MINDGYRKKVVALSYHRIVSTIRQDIVWPRDVFAKFYPMISLGVRAWDELVDDYVADQVGCLLHGDGMGVVLEPVWACRINLRCAP